MRTPHSCGLIGLFPLVLMLLSPHPAWAQPAPGEIEHVVVVMMENRSFDHMLGWVPGANGQQQNTYFDSAGNPHDTQPLAPDYQGCSNLDPGHSYWNGRVQWNQGAADGWLFDSVEVCTGEVHSSEADLYAIGYYLPADLPLYAGLTQNYTLCDMYFTPIMASTWPNKIYQYAADTDRLCNTISTSPPEPKCTAGFPSTLPTIFDTLLNAGVSVKYYFTDVPFVVLWGAQYLPITRHITEFHADAAAGTLPSVSFIDPRFLVENFGTSCDDHPKADIRCGQDFLNVIYESVVLGPDWPTTALVINYDEWGGFFDHVDPASAPGGTPPMPPAQANLENTFVGPDCSRGLRGFRIPCFVISPWSRAPGGSIDSTVYDHASVLAMIEWNWSLPALTVRDSTANNLASTLNSVPDLSPPPLFSVPAVVSPLCRPSDLLILGPSEWMPLYDAAVDLGVYTSLGLPPVNDDCLAALPVLAGDIPFDTSLATTGFDPDLGVCFGDGIIHKDVWYRFVADFTGTAVASTCDTVFDTRIAAYEDLGDCPPDPLATLLDCSDDACGAQSVVVFPVAEGNSYVIHVGGALPGESGIGTLSITGQLVDTFVRGDLNDDGAFDISDAIFLLNSLFTPGSPPPPCADAADVNDDGGVDVADGVYILGVLFQSTPPPPAPFPDCGEDPTGDSLDCDSYSGCP